MQTQTKISPENFASKVIAAMGLENLEATRRKKLRIRLQDMLAEYIINALFSTLDEAEKENLTTKLEDTENMEDFFDILFAEVPFSREIMQEETEILFARLTK